MNGLPSLFFLKWKRFYQCHASFRGWLRTWIESYALCVCVWGNRKRAPECVICHGPGLKMMELSEVQDVINTAHWSTLSRCLLQGLREKQSLTVRLPQIPSIMSQLFQCEQLTFSFSFHLFTLLLFLAAAFFSDWVWAGLCCMLNIHCSQFHLTCLNL